MSLEQVIRLEGDTRSELIVFATIIEVESDFLQNFVIEISLKYGKSWDLIAGKNKTISQTLKEARRKYGVLLPIEWELCVGALEDWPTINVRCLDSQSETKRVLAEGTKILPYIPGSRVIKIPISSKVASWWCDQNIFFLNESNYLGDDQKRSLTVGVVKIDLNFSFNELKK